METTAKIFINGRSQAVRLPKEFRFDCSEVKIKKVGKTVILEPIEKVEWPRGFWKIFKEDKKFDIPEPLSKKSVELD